MVRSDKNKRHNYPKTRKSPTKHIVKAHKRRGRQVEEFERGSRPHSGRGAKGR